MSLNSSNLKDLKELKDNSSQVSFLSSLYQHAYLTREAELGNIVKYSDI